MADADEIVVLPLSVALPLTRRLPSRLPTDASLCANKLTVPLLPTVAPMPPLLLPVLNVLEELGPPLTVAVLLLLKLFPVFPLVLSVRPPCTSLPPVPSGPGAYEAATGWPQLDGFIGRIFGFGGNGGGPF